MGGTWSVRDAVWSCVRFNAPCYLEQRWYFSLTKRSIAATIHRHHCSPNDIMWQRPTSTLRSSRALQAASQMSTTIESERKSQESSKTSERVKHHKRQEGGSIFSYSLGEDGYNLKAGCFCPVPCTFCAIELHSCVQALISLTAVTHRFDLFFHAFKTF